MADRVRHKMWISSSTQPQQLSAFVALVPSERAYIDERTALDALSSCDMFNVIDMNTGWKADLIVKKRRAFSVAEFELRVREEWELVS